MAPHTVACPQCQTALRSQRPLAAGALVRCPQCGNHFLPVSAPAVLPAAPSNLSRSLLLLLIPASFAALLLGAAVIVGTYLLVRPQSPPAPLVDDQRERKLADEQRQLDDANKELAAQREQLAEEQRRQQFSKLMDRGQKYLTAKDYDDAKSTYESALHLYPTDKDALAGLAQATTAATAESRDTDEQRKRQAAFDKFMEQGQQALAAKRYAEAIIDFESALTLMPGETAAQALADAKKELDKDKGEKEKLATYQKFLAAGNAALTAGRYADAIREYLGAQGVIPGDAAAVKGQKDAEQKLANAKEQADVDKLVADGRKALGDKKYRDASRHALDALRILPGDPDATKLVNDAKKGYDSAEVDYKRLMTAADAARAAQRYEEAKGLYGQALAVLPGDEAALKAQQALQNGLDGQAAYTRFMTAGAQALTANRFADAASAFTEALRLAPNDLDATKGLAVAQAALARLADYNRFMTLAAAALTKKLYRDAVAAYRDALIAVPDDPLAIAGLREAKYLRSMTDGDKAMLAVPKKFTEAIRFYEEALKEMPGDKTALMQLSSARYQRALLNGTAAMAARKFANAVPLLEEALKERPTDVNAKIQLHEAKFGRALADGDAAMKAQKYDDAISAYQDALREKPNDSKATRALAQARKLKKP